MYVQTGSSVMMGPPFLINMLQKKLNFKLAGGKLQREHTMEHRQGALSVLAFVRSTPFYNPPSRTLLCLVWGTSAHCRGAFLTLSSTRLRIATRPWLVLSFRVGALFWVHFVPSFLQESRIGSLAQGRSSGRSCRSWCSPRWRVSTLCAPGLCENRLRPHRVRRGSPFGPSF